MLPDYLVAGSSLVISTDREVNAIVRTNDELRRVDPVAGDSVADRLQVEAARLFRLKGYEATSTRELAELVGVQKASLYHHMGSKGELLYGICLSSLANIQAAATAAIEAEPDPVARVPALIRAHVRSMLDERDKHATMLTEMRALAPEHHQEVLRLRDVYQSLVRTTLSDAQQAGGLRRDIGVGLLALGLLDLLNWAIFWYRPREGLSPDELADVFVTLFLRGAGAQPAPANTSTGNGSGLAGRRRPIKGEV